MIKGISSNNTPTPCPLNTPSARVEETPMHTSDMPTIKTSMYTATAPVTTSSVLRNLFFKNTSTPIPMPTPMPIAMPDSSAQTATTVENFKALIKKCEERIEFLEENNKKLKQGIAELESEQKKLLAKRNSYHFQSTNYQYWQEKVTKNVELVRSYYQGLEDQKTEIRVLKGQIEIYKAEIQRLQSQTETTSDVPGASGASGMPTSTPSW